MPYICLIYQHQKKNLGSFSISFVKATFEALCVQSMVQFTVYSFYPTLHTIGVSQTGQAKPNTFHTELCHTRKNLGGKQQQ